MAHRRGDHRSSSRCGFVTIRKACVWGNQQYSLNIPCIECRSLCDYARSYSFVIDNSLRWIRTTYGRPYNLHKIKYLHTKKRRTYQKVWRFVYQKSDNIKHCFLLLPKSPMPAHCLMWKHSPWHFLPIRQYWRLYNMIS